MVSYKNNKLDTFLAENLFLALIIKEQDHLRCFRFSITKIDKKEKTLNFSQAKANQQLSSKALVENAL